MNKLVQGVRFIQTGQVMAIGSRITSDRHEFVHDYSITCIFPLLSDRVAVLVEATFKHCDLL